jgi:hypothetical protein
MASSRISLGAACLLNLPTEKHSHGLRKLAAIEASRGSYESASQAIERQTGERVDKLQLEQLVARAAVDFDAYYRVASRQPCAVDAVLVISCDGKGIVMRSDALREATRRAAAQSEHKLAVRLSKGEKANRKRMATVGCVYDIDPVVHTPQDILRPPAEERSAVAAPAARGKWVMASVVDDAATVVARLFDEAERRDPDHRRTWVVLVGGNNHQLDLIRAEARRRKVTVSIVLDFIHVLEYIWKAAWSLHDEGDSAAETWVQAKATSVFEGQASRVAGAIRRSATRRGLIAAQERRRLRRLPAQQDRLPRLRRGTRQRMADRHRGDRRCLPAPRQGPHGHHRCALGSARRRGGPQAARTEDKRSLRGVLGLPPAPREAANPPVTASGQLGPAMMDVTPAESHPSHNGERRPWPSARGRLPSRGPSPRYG